MRQPTELIPEISFELRELLRESNLKIKVRKRSAACFFLHVSAKLSSLIFTFGELPP